MKSRIVSSFVSISSHTGRSGSWDKFGVKNEELGEFLKLVFLIPWTNSGFL